jgi:hypothetical protein
MPKPDFFAHAMPKQLTIQVGDVPVAIEADGRLPEWDVLPAYRPFLAGVGGDVVLRLYAGIPENHAGEKVFDSSPIWTLHRGRHTSVIEIFENFSGLHNRLVLPRHMNRADLYFADNGDRFPGPFFGPAVELLMVNYLARERGIIVHACGVVHCGKGILLAGESGAGKSTLAGCWNGEAHTEILSDDRIIVRKQGGKFWMYGTPWHGDAGFASPRGVRLDKIFFLKHGRDNSVRPAGQAETVMQLLKCSFPPYWETAGMEFTMDLFGEIAAAVPCHEFQFTPDRRAIDSIKTRGAL